MFFSFSRKFEKDLGKCQPGIRYRFYERIELFEKDRFHPLLNNHALVGKLKGTRSINIDGDWRALFIERGDNIHFLEIGTHSKLYH